MLRIGKLTDYGTLVMTHMALRPDQLHSAAEIAEALGLGLPTVSKVLKILGRNDLVLSIRGARGGYTLARPATAITVADIIDALEEQPFGLTECSATSGACGLEGDCRIRVTWQRINTVVRHALEEVSLAEMVGPAPPGAGVFPLRGPAEAAKPQLS